MKKILIHIGLIVAFIIIYLLQSIFFNQFTIAGIMPNIFIILMLYIGLYMGRTMGIIYGIIFGIFIDLWIGKTLGFTSIALALIGVSLLDHYIVADNDSVSLAQSKVAPALFNYYED